MILARDSVMDDDINSAPLRTPTNSPLKVHKRRLNSPSASPARKSPRKRSISRLPIRRPTAVRPVVKELNLPPDESVFATSPPQPASTKVTPEKLMQELKEQVAKKLLQRERKTVQVDDEISIPFTEMVIVEAEKGANEEGPGESPLARKLPVRVSTRIHSQVTVESPDLPVEDPLEIARQTLQNTRLNSGYRSCQLVFSNEFVDKPRPDSPEHAFSQQIGLQRHILKIPPSSESEGTEEDSSSLSRRKLRFNRVLHFLDSEESDEGEVSIAENDKQRENLPFKPCLKSSSAVSREWENEPNKRNLVQVKRLIYPGSFASFLESSSSSSAAASRPRRLFGGAKRAPARNQ